MADSATLSAWLLDRARKRLVAMTRERAQDETYRQLTSLLTPALRVLAGAHGAVVAMDERVREPFAACNVDTEWFMYGFGVLHCLPVCTADQPSAGIGAVMRPDTLRQHTREAGFCDAVVLPIETSFYTFLSAYHLTGRCATHR